MADTKKDTKKVKTDEKAAETIVDEVTAESTDTAETTTTDVNVTETVDVPEEQAEAAKPKPVAKENRRGSKALREENDKLKESSKMYDFGAKDVLGKLLPVVDNFERAIAAIPEEDKDRPFEAGVDKIYKSLMTSLESIGVTPMNCEGEQFDPAFHNAVMHVEDENYGENVIVEEMQRGYMYKDQVLRFSMVKVAN